MHYDVFNGDADGILSALQLRLAEPKDSQLITGVKRDIALLDRVDSNLATSVTVLDISMEKNQSALRSLLANQVPVSYFDHHRTGEIPNHPLLDCKIDTDANVCTALLVNQFLQNRYPLWAITAAFGDNLIAVANKMCQQLGLSETLTTQLKRLGICINYNGYGRTVEDLHFAPADLFKQLLAYESPELLIADKDSVHYALQDAYDQDMTKAKSAQLVYDADHCKVLLLPDDTWAHRVSGVYGNDLANKSPDCAHAVLTPNANGDSYTVSVRAPLNNKQGADNVCSQFATGGGRSGAAGINALPVTALDMFTKCLSDYYA
jgi:hypothetical protein